MSIVSSTYVLDGPAKADGKQDVIETHTDSISGIHIVRYRAAVGANYQSIANSRAAVVNEQLVEKEMVEVING